MRPLVLLALLLAACGAERRGVTLFAAASTTDALTRIARQYERETGEVVRLSFASSGALARQILAGAPADLFLSAAPLWSDELAANGLVREQRVLLANRLVLVAPAGSTDLERARRGRLAIADPDHAPAGIYAKQALRHLGWWEEARALLVPCADVREALQFVARGEVDGAIVYTSDAAVAAGVVLLYTFPAESHEAIRYPLALLDARGEALYRYLGGPGARAIFAEAGFLP